MPNFNSSYHQAVLDTPTNLRTAASMDVINQTKRTAVFAITLVGTEAAADTLTLGSLKIPGARIIPEECRVRHGAGGAGVSLPSTIRKVDKDLANPVTLSSTVTLVSTAVQTFASANALELPLLAKDDVLQILLSGTVTTLATRIVYVEIAYRLRGR